MVSLFNFKLLKVLNYLKCLGDKKDVDRKYPTTMSATNKRREKSATSGIVDRDDGRTRSRMRVISDFCKGPPEDLR